jgi:hypothetical protein
MEMIHYEEYNWNIHGGLKVIVAFLGLQLGYTKFRYFYVVMTVYFGMKLFNDQRNAQVFNLFYLFTSALNVSGFLLAHF